MALDFLDERVNKLSSELKRLFGEKSVEAFSITRVYKTHKYKGVDLPTVRLKFTLWSDFVTDPVLHQVIASVYGDHKLSIILRYAEQYQEFSGTKIDFPYPEYAQTWLAK